MTGVPPPMLDAFHLTRLAAWMQRGSEGAAETLERWTDKQTTIERSTLEQVALPDTTTTLPAGAQPMCFCVTSVQGVIAGKMILAFDDPSGLALVDCLLDQPSGTTGRWTELAKSALLETTNIVCCGFLNSIVADHSGDLESNELLPTPPRFLREFPESLVQSASMSQAMQFDRLVFSKARFTIEPLAAHFTLLFFPDGDTMEKIIRQTITGSTEH